MSLMDMVRRRDPDRYFCALFAPSELRAALFTLYAFNAELARAQEVAREPGLALIRLQWWREVVEGAERRHEVASPLRALLDAGTVAAASLLDMIAAREADVEGAAETLDAFVDRMRRGPGSLAVAAGSLGGGDPGRLRDLGAAYGVAGTLRNVAAFGAGQRCVLPMDAVRGAGVALLGVAAPVPRRVLGAALPAVLARRDLARSAPVGVRGVGDRAAVVWAAVLGKV
jgi:phytoene synthase